MNRDLEVFQRMGFVILRNVVSCEDIEMVRSTFFMLCHKLVPNFLIGDQLFDGSVFAEEFCDLKRKRPDITGAVYDTMQSSLSLINLVCNEVIVNKVADLLTTRIDTLSNFFRCLRIDVPGNNPNALGWHQDFMVSEKASLDASAGITVWIPLHRVDERRGTLELCVGSHHDRVRDVSITSRNEKNASEYISIPDSYIDSFSRYCVEAEAGDVVLMSMNTIHRTAQSQSSLIRFTAIGRFFRLSSPEFVYGAPKYVASKLV